MGRFGPADRLANKGPQSGTPRPFWPAGRLTLLLRCIQSVAARARGGRKEKEAPAATGLINVPQQAAKST